MTAARSVEPEPADVELINFDLLAQLAEKPHPLLHIADDFERQIREIPLAWVCEIFQQARSAHHLLDMADIPTQTAYKSDLDSRAYLAIRQIIKLREQIDRIKSWHSRETGPAGTVGDYCTECGTRWPCDTWRLADGSYTDDE